ncbi:PREDICTED: zinc finger B-box domain-containing protein 1 [Elephantulus edwardii]|uniref:zinc finger B-box domain-containing protein 1 n=1 Tax=Elephantulus edwardii TaxID=28737 RepID=UPI0003F08894|nr:PREDICTED: zinc finger B-box domain-containing protein 1 [Elephantulus edwardii]
MNTKDFVVLPWGKPGNSVKLKYKDVRELKVEKVQLELENQALEKKLRELDSARNKEGDKRESNGCHWKSGQVGKLSNRSHMMPQNKGNVIKLTTGKVKLKLLKEDIQEPVKQPLYDKMTNSENATLKRRGKVCGQCENKAALLVCLDCGEDYCSGCFAKIHQKGALKLHRTALLQAKSQVLSSVLDIAHRFIKDVNPEEPKRKNNSTKEIRNNHHKLTFPQDSSSEVKFTTSTPAEFTNQEGGFLCEGSFDEAASARSFQEALNQWRAGNQEARERQNFCAAKPESMEACEVQTNLKIVREPLEIEFKEDSLSYVEKLWLKKLRRAQHDQLSNMQSEDNLIHSNKTTSGEQFSSNGSDKESHVEEAKVPSPAFYLLVEELKLVRLDPSLKIVELDDTYQGGSEEPGEVPYKVELPNTDHKRSVTPYDYQNNNFPNENSIFQHWAFNKEKTDFFNFWLTNHSSYHKDNSEAVGTSNTDFHSITDADVDSPAIEKIKVNSFGERNVSDGDVDGDNSQTSADSCIPLESKNTFSSIGLEELSTKAKITQDIKESLDFSNLHEKPNSQDSKMSKSPLLLEEVALRKKPRTEFKKLFVFDANESLTSLPSSHVKLDSSSIGITLSADREWIPEHSVSSYADDASVLDVLQSTYDPSSVRRQPTIGQASQRPSTVNLPLSRLRTTSSSVLSSSSCLLPRSAAAPSVSRAALEIAEIEHIDVPDPNGPFLDNMADQQTLENLQKELSQLRRRADPSEDPYSLSSEELAAFSSLAPDISETTGDFLQALSWRGPCGVEEQSSSRKDTEIPSVPEFSGSSTEEDEEVFLDKQLVMTLPWSDSS